MTTLRDSAGAETVWVLGTDYTLSAAGVSTGGTLTAITIPATNETLVITLEPPNTQTTNIPLGGSFPASSVEDSLDLASQRDAKIQEILDRTLRVQKSDTRSGSQLEIPNETDRANEYLYFDANGDVTTAAETDSGLRTELASSASGEGSSLIDFSRNLGLGVTLEAWHSTYTALQAAGLGASWGTTAQSAGSEYVRGCNVYRNASGNESYIIADEASKIVMADGIIIFYTNSGTPVADATITWLETARFNVTGLTMLGSGVSSKPPVTAGTATAYTATWGLSAYETNRVYEVRPHTDNTGAFTMNFAGSARNVRLLDGTDPVASQFKTGMAAKLMPDATNLVLLNPFGDTKPSFSVHKGGATQGNITGEQILTWSTEIFDTNSNFASNRFTPTVAGKYSLTTAVVWSGIVAGDRLELIIYKNGAQANRVYTLAQGTSAGQTISVVVDANGTTDNFEVYAEDLDRDTGDISGNLIDTYFMGCKIN